MTKRWVEYRSKDWEKLVAAGWITAFIFGSLPRTRWAQMIQLPAAYRVTVAVTERTA